jgi:hypothetical protein
MTEWRYIAQRIPSGEFVEWNVPLSDVEVTTALSGPGRLTGSIPVELSRMKGPDGRPLFQEWGTAIWAEADGQIRGGGILVQSDFEDGAWRIDCMGYSGYPQGMPWVRDPFYFIQEDPMNLVRFIWQMIQNEENGNLGVVVDNTTSPLRIGDAPEKTTNKSVITKPDPKDPKKTVTETKETPIDMFTSVGPYHLNWWSSPNLGTKIDELAANGPFDYQEEDYWDGDTLKHKLRLYYPRVGRRRTDLRFVVGENIAVVPTVVRGGADYTDEVMLLGAGEGRERVWAREVSRTKRMRRVTLLDLRGVSDYNLAVQEARDELKYRQGLESVETVEVEDHPHARLGSYTVGDEILLQGNTGWFDLDLWVRILEITIRPEDKSRAILTVARSEVVS